MLKINAIVALICLSGLSTAGTNLEDILAETKLFFQQTDQIEVNLPQVYRKLHEFELLIQRSFDLKDEQQNQHRVSKRSLGEITSLTNGGTYLVQKLKEVTSIPTRLAHDIIPVTSHGNSVYFLSLESNPTSTKLPFSDDIALYKHSDDGTVKELSRIAVLGGSRLDVHTIHGVTYVVVAEYNAGENHEPLEGSSLYKIVNYNKRTVLEKVQTLNVTRPKVVAFWSYMDEVYLAVGTGFGDDRKTSSTFIYKWLGQHFDSIQEILSFDSRSVTPFVIGSFMFLAIGNHQDKYGNTDIDSEIFRFRLQDSKFESYQKIRTNGVEDLKHFEFEDKETGEKEHFLVVANSFQLSSDGTRDYLINSVIYKFVDDYFIPFQSFKIHGAKRWLPVEGPDGKFLLLVIGTYGVTGFQYDGWRFSQVSLEFPQRISQEKMYPLISYQDSGKVLLIVSTKNEFSENLELLEVVFVKKDQLDQGQAKMELWCEEAKSQLLRLDNNTMEDFRKLEDSQRRIASSSFQFENVDIGTLETVHFAHLNADLVLQVNQLHQQLLEMEAELEQLSTSSEKTVNNIDPIKMPYLELECPGTSSCTFDKADVVFLNNENLENFLENTVRLDEVVSVDSLLEMENAEVRSDVTPERINGHRSAMLLDGITESLLDAELVVNGTVVLHSELKVNGLVDGVRFNQSQMLLVQGHQLLTGVLSVDTVTIRDLELEGKLDGVRVEDLQKPREVDVNPSETSFDRLNVHDLHVLGTLSGVNLSHIMSQAVRRDYGTSGGSSASLAAGLFLDSLTSDEVLLRSEALSDTRLKDVLLRTAGQDYAIAAELLLDQSVVQVRNLTLTSPSRRQQELADDVIVFVDAAFLADDILDSSLLVSLLNVSERGLRLNETTIDSRMELCSAEAKQLLVDRVNHEPVAAWVSDRSGRRRRISGRKTIRGSARVVGGSNVRQVNNVVLEQLEADCLRLSGEQIVRGSLTFAKVTCDKIEADKVQIDNVDWEAVLKKPEQLVVRGSVTADVINAENATVNGTVDGFYWDELVQDSILEPEAVVTGVKTIVNLEAENMTVSGKLILGSSAESRSVEEFVRDDRSDEDVHVLENVLLRSPLYVEELTAQGQLDSVSCHNFGRTWLLADVPQVIPAPLSFRNVRLSSGSKLRNLEVNNVNLRRLFEESLKLNEDAELDSISFGDGFATHSLILEGPLNQVSFRQQVVLSSAEDAQHFEGDVVFAKDVVVGGALIVGGLVSGTNMSRLCSSLPGHEAANLIVGGSLKLKREPQVKVTVQDKELHALGGVWMKDSPANLGGKCGFEDVESHGQIILSGTVNDVNLTSLEKKYLSRTRGRVMMSDVEVPGISVGGLVRVRSAEVKGTVNGLELNRFAKNVLLQGQDQVIRGITRFRQFHSRHISLNGTVNGRDLEREVLRYDVAGAAVTAHKTFLNLMTQNLNTAHGKSVQGVLVEDWDRNCVKTREAHTVVGSVRLGRSSFRGGLRVGGKVNDHLFDKQHMLIARGNQTVTARKRFELSQAESSSPLLMKFLKVKGSVNSVDLDRLISEQAYQGAELRFTGAKKLSRGLAASHVDLRSNFQGIDVTGLCDRAQRPRQAHGTDREFKSLLNRTKQMRENLERQPYFLDRFELVHEMKHISAVVPLADDQGRLMLSVFDQKQTYLMEWDAFADDFVADALEVRNLSGNVTYVTSGLTRDGFFLYIESADSATIIHSGSPWKIAANGTSCVTPMRIKEANTTCFFVGQHRNVSRIMCPDSRKQQLEVFQTIAGYGTVEASVVDVAGEIYLLLISKERVKDKLENTLSLFRFDEDSHRLVLHQAQAELNPVSVSSIAFEDDHYVACATGHAPGNVNLGSVRVFIFDLAKKLSFYQTIKVAAPVDVHFAVLPSSQLVLYVLTSDSAQPLIVFVHKGAQKFVEEARGLSLFSASRLQSFTDSSGQHFLILSGRHQGQVVRAGFKGTNFK